MQLGPIRFMPASEMHPDPSALEEYQRVFPRRYLKWNVGRQLWEVWQYNEVLGADEFYEFVFWYAPVFDDDGVPIPEEEMEELIRTGSPRVRKVFRDFDHRFVRQRIRAAFEFRDLGVARYHDRQAAILKQARLRKIRQTASDMAEGMKELYRYLPALASGHWGDRKPIVTGAALTI
ncbi:MAG: hypothetical protein AB7N73_14485 [Gemmatimonadales bacterium]